MNRDDILSISAIFATFAQSSDSRLAAMVVKIRLARFGRTNTPFYNIVVAHARTARNSKPLEVIGTYDPVPKKTSYDKSGKLHKDIQLDIDRAKYWIGVGAQPTDPVWRFLSMLGILEPKYKPKPKTPPPPMQTDTTTTTKM